MRAGDVLRTAGGAHFPGFAGARLLPILVLIGGLSWAVALPSRAATSDPPVSRALVERLVYLEARAAIRRGDRKRFTRLSASLQDYPLYPWLRYIEFRRNYGRHPESEIEEFLATVPNSPISDLVRGLWLDRLARQHRWERFLEVYASMQPGGLDARRRCLHARALLETGNDFAGFEATAKLWRVPRSQDKACDRTFALWTKRGGRTSEHLWHRIEISLRRGNRGLAAYVARLLDKPDRAIAERWIRDYRRPLKIVSRAGQVGRKPAWRVPVSVAIANLARRNPGAAARAWRTAAEGSPPPPAELNAFASWRIGLGFAQDHRIPEAVEWVERVPEELRSPRLLGVLALLYLAQGRWADTLAALDALPPEPRDELQWQYWRARALSALGRTEEAPWAELAAKRDYYGFLAADRIGAPYRIRQEPAGSSPESIEHVGRMGGLRRAQEFNAIGLQSYFNREWRYLVNHLEGSDLTAAATIASRNGWYFEAIRAAARARAFDRLDLRFPVVWKDQAISAADAHGIDPAWILATIRMESAFRPRARSPAGALGLMQVMPATARRIAKAAGVRYAGTRTVLNPEENIRLGAAYLRFVLERMQGHAALASASYNAGPHRAERWLAAAPGMEPDLWVEFIPYSETRKYVKRILEYRIVYRHLLGATGGGMRELLPALPSPSR